VLVLIVVLVCVVVLKVVVVVVRVLVLVPVVFLLALVVVLLVVLVVVVSPDELQARLGASEAMAAPPIIVPVSFRNCRRVIGCSPRLSLFQAYQHLPTIISKQ